MRLGHFLVCIVIQPRKGCLLQLCYTLGHVSLPAWADGNMLRPGALSDESGGKTPELTRVPLCVSMNVIGRQQAGLFLLQLFINWLVSAWQLFLQQLKTGLGRPEMGFTVCCAHCQLGGKQRLTMISWSLVWWLTSK